MYTPHQIWPGINTLPFTATPTFMVKSVCSALLYSFLSSSTHIIFYQPPLTPRQPLIPGFLPFHLFQMFSTNCYSPQCVWVSHVLPPPCTTVYRIHHILHTQCHAHKPCNTHVLVQEVLAAWRQICAARTELW